MSQFDNFNDACFDQAKTVFGGKVFTLDGVTIEAGGIVNEFQFTKEIYVDGAMLNVDATLMVGIAALSAYDQPLEKSLEGKTVVIQGRTYRVETVSVDTLTATLILSTPPRGRAS